MLESRCIAARLNRLVEAADLAAAQDLFGGSIDLDAMQPRSAKELEDFAAALAAKYMSPHAKSAHYKAFVKAVRGAMPC